MHFGQNTLIEHQLLLTWGISVFILMLSVYALCDSIHLTTAQILGT